MNERYNEAVDRIRDEMAKEAGNPGIQFIGGWLTGELAKRPELAEKLLDEKKSVKGAFDQIYKYAKEHKTGNYAFVPPGKALEIVSEYYGFSADVEKQETQALAPEPKPKKADAFDLDAMLGGL